MMMEHEDQTPCASRVETLISKVMAEHPGKTQAAQHDYFEAVHQQLAPLARELELENEALRAKLEAAEKSDAESIAMYRRARDERDTLRAKIEQMEKQVPVAWLHESRRDSDVVTNAVKHVWGKAAVGSMAAYSIPLYTLPVAQPAPSVPDGWKLVPIVSTDEMDNAGSDHCDGYLSTAQAVWDAMLAAAPKQEEQ